MHEIVFYRDRKGREPVLEYIQKLASLDSKESRIKLNKVNDYIEALSQYGTIIGEPFVKHVEGEIWELRPRRDRILFSALGDGRYVLLHCFEKKSRKTPRREIEKALSELKDIKMRMSEDE